MVGLEADLEVDSVERCVMDCWFEKFRSIVIVAVVGYGHNNHPSKKR